MTYTHSITDDLKLLKLGKQGETGVTEHAFDMTAWLDEWPDGVIVVSFCPPRSAAWIDLPPEQAIVEGNLLTLLVLHNLTARSGRGLLNIRLVDGTDAELRSALIETYVSVTFGAMEDPESGGGGTFPEAPLDGRLYGRQNAAWAYIDLTNLEESGLSWKGAWTSSAAYTKDDVVSDEGSSFVAKTANVNSKPALNPLNWDLMAQKGTPGTGGGDLMTFDTFGELILGAEEIEAGTLVKTNGYLAPNDQGGAIYKITATEEHDWDLPLIDGKWASIQNRDSVSYRMFGAPLNGIDDDGPAMRKAHKYADSVYIVDGRGVLPMYLCKVENHQGTIYKKDPDAITFNSDIDLSGSILKVDDVNATWFGIYVWGDNDSLRWTYEPSDTMKATFTRDNHVITPITSHGSGFPGNAVIKLMEDPYTARDDSGYSYTVARRELIVHDLDGMCSSPFTDDWYYAGGEEISVLVSDLINGGYKTETFYTTFTTSYNFAHPRHGTFIGCEVQMDVSADKYHCCVWVKRHNCELKNFTFVPLVEQLHNTKYKNTMIYLWDSYNVRVENIQGFNAAGKKIGSSNATSGYILRLTNCSDVEVTRCRLQGYWGATAMDSVKNIRFDHCHINRLDIHDYFSNLWANECVFYNHAVQIGYGRGIASFTNSRVHLRPSAGDSYPGSSFISLNMSYGRIFEGTLYINNCQIITKNLPDNEFNMLKAEFSPDATTITPHFKFPEVICENTQVYSLDSGTHFSYFKITGSRRGTTSGVRPSHVKDVSGDGTVRWRYQGRALDWDVADSGVVALDQIVRVTDRFLDEEVPPKTQFYNKRYYRVTAGGELNLAGAKPTNTSGTPFTNGTATLVYVGPDILWKAKYAYSLNDLVCVSHSEWLPMFIFKCEQAGTSNGYFPTHSSGTEIDGVNDPVNEPDSIWWSYVAAASGWLTPWTANMNVTLGQRLLVENRIYEVMQSGVMETLPPYKTGWMVTYDCGTAKVKFIGQQWAPRAWFPLDGYCEARGKIYKVVNHAGTTSGILPVRGNEFCVDGDLVWKYISGDNTLPGQTGSDTWQAQTAYAQGAAVVSNANTYEAFFDGKMVLPHKTVFRNVLTNMTDGQVFWFYAGTNIPTKAGDKPWVLIAEDCEGIARGAKFPSGMTQYFGNANNTNPSVVLANTGDSAGGTISGITGLQAALDGKTANLATPLDNTKDLNVHARLGGFYTTVWDTANNPTTSAAVVMVIPGVSNNTAFAQLAFVTSTNKFYYRTAKWVSDVLTFTAWTELGAGGGGIADAPSDTKLYGRKDAAWVEVPAGGSNDSTVNNVRVIKDVGRLYSPGNTGILRISLGAAPSGDTFICGRIYGYIHGTPRQMWSMDFAAYVAGSWGTLKVVKSPNCPFTDVRRAMYNGYPCILLGTTSTAWGYQMAYIPEIIVAYTGIASIAAAWPMAVVNSETGITSIVAADEIKTLAVVT